MTIKRDKRYFISQLIKLDNCTLPIEEIEKLTIIQILEETEKLKIKNAEIEIGDNLFSKRFGFRY